MTNYDPDYWRTKYHALCAKWKYDPAAEEEAITRLKRCSLSSRQAAERIGCSYRSIPLWRRGESNISVRFVQRINSGVLDANVDTVLSAYARQRRKPSSARQPEIVNPFNL